MRAARFVRVRLLRVQCHSSAVLKKYGTYDTCIGCFGSILYFNDKEKYLLTFKNNSYNYQNESFWLSKKTKLELHQLIKEELEKKTKYKNIEIILDNNVVLVLSINKKKANFNFWDGYSWVNSSWYRLFKINNLFGK